ncbi:MAG: MlaD family protein [Gemmatimonadota bacterium]|nr:MlaD family protein [Gemmatimonadota bacterium]MDH3427608.1 MlaD family protein [Gemmatimonadota bacterium]
MRDPGLRRQHRLELQVGALLILAFIGLVAGILWISGARWGGNDITLFVATDDAASVSEGSDVTLRGVPIGTVESVRLVGDGVVLRLALSPRGRLPSDTRASIESTGFIGQMLVGLQPGTASDDLASGDTIPALVAPGLNSLADQLGGQATDLLDRTRRLLSDSLITSVGTGAGAFAGTMGGLEVMLDRQSRTLEQLIENLSRLSGQLSDATDGPELESTVANIDSLAARLAAASENFGASSEALASILRKIDDGEGSMGKLVNDPVLHDRMAAAMENLQAATEEIALLTKDVREQPQRYLAGLKVSVF